MQIEYLHFNIKVQQPTFYHPFPHLLESHCLQNVGERAKKKTKIALHAALAFSNLGPSRGIGQQLPQPPHNTGIMRSVVQHT